MGTSIINLSSVTTVGLDLAKHVFQVHCVDASGRVVVAKAIRRNKLLEFFASLPPCLVGLEASGSAHHWARELIAEDMTAPTISATPRKALDQRATSRHDNAQQQDGIAGALIDVMHLPAIDPRVAGGEGPFVPKPFDVFQSARGHVLPLMR